MTRKTGVLFSYILMAVQILSTMLLTPFLIRTLGQAEYGVYNLILSITSYFVLLDLGVGSSVVRYMSKYCAQRDIEAQRKFLGVTTIYYTIIAIVTIIIGFVVRDNIQQIFDTGLTESEIKLAEKLFLITIITIAVSFATSAFSNALIAYEQFSISKGISIVMTVLKIVLSIAALKLGFSSFGVVVVNLITTLLTSAVYIFYVIFKLKITPSFKNIDFSFAKEIASYSLFIFFQIIAGSINTMSPQILLGAFAKNSAVIIGVFSIGTQVLQYFKTMGSQFTGVLAPGLVRFSQGELTREQYEQEMIRISRIIFMVLSLVWTVFLVFGMDFICLWAGEEYRQAYYIALILMMPNLFSFSEGSSYQLLQAMAKHKLPAVLQLATSLLGVVLTTILILWKPLEGAVIGTFAAFMICEVIVMNIMYKKQIGMRLTIFFKGMLKGTVPSLVITGLFGGLIKMLDLFGDGWFAFILNCSIMVAVYAACMLTFGMNSSEKELVKGIVSKTLKLIRVKH